MEYELFTDGACEPNPGSGGWAFILRPEDDVLDQIEESGEEENTTNNRMELLAVIKGIVYYKAYRYKANDSLLIFSDSRYVIYGINEWVEGWERKNWMRKDNKPVLNVDLWKQVLLLKRELPMEGVFVRGHSGHPENERCDKLAVNRAKRLKESRG